MALFLTMGLALKALQVPWVMAGNVLNGGAPGGDQQPGPARSRDTGPGDGPDNRGAAAPPPPPPAGQRPVKQNRATTPV
jgi:hypothetical protein